MVPVPGCALAPGRKSVGMNTDLQTEGLGCRHCPAIELLLSTSGAMVPSPAPRKKLKEKVKDLFRGISEVVLLHHSKTGIEYYIYHKQA